MNYIYLWIITVCLIMSIVMMKADYEDRMQYFIVTIISILVALSEL